MIDADELFKEDRAEFEKNPIFTNYDVYMSEVLREIDNAPTVVIRCKDCKYFHSETHIRNAYPYSLEDGAKITVTKTECTAHELTMPREIDFCSRAEPKQR